ncbi:hypothetical protein CF326_g4483 [Tilletia indica]|uniref:Uncharacterized protein n=1 Tax=Tilletia indica TaxID=43049 RepID=A0A177TN95_9BASI|nr:hypothetical protein CF326_g4483 [Tilletia indica]KAE8238532.1 hypothetical protein A4X13_0g8473 [Tilletia indica]
MPPSDATSGPIVASIPAALQRHINVLQGSHENCGRLTNSLVRLDITQQSLEDIVQRHVSGLANELDRLQQDIEEDQVRLDNSVTQLRDHFHRVQEDINVIKQRTLKRFTTASLRLSEAQSQDFSTVLDRLKLCINTLGPSLRSAETDLIRVETQLVGLNSWNVAWPEAIVAAHNQQESGVPPPQYAVPQQTPTTSGNTAVQA